MEIREAECTSEITDSPCWYIARAHQSEWAVNHWLTKQMFTEGNQLSPYYNQLRKPLLQSQLNLIPMIPMFTPSALNPSFYFPTHILALSVYILNACVVLPEFVLTAAVAVLQIA